jgi:hypothetical protein
MEEECEGEEKTGNKIKIEEKKERKERNKKQT